jgi:hypothetical protein
MRRVFLGWEAWLPGVLAMRRSEPRVAAVPAMLECVGGLVGPAMTWQVMRKRRGVR